MSDVRVRFAPSPTGYLHIGGARTALFNWFYARKMGGKLVLRIEDTDIERQKDDSVAQIIASLKWLGLEWDEGPEKDGPYRPYYQSERLALYRQEAERLLAEGKAYYCFCSAAELDAQREQLRRAGKPFRYNGKCTALPPEEVQRRLAAGEKPVIRFRVPRNEQVDVDDLIHGRISFAPKQLDDFVIVKSNAMPAYNFACVVDDSNMAISHVIRAEEHLSNTPKQVLLYQALGYPLPHFAHVPMILAPDRSKLSKRHGATSVEEFRDQGYLAEAIVNYLTLLGWSPGGDREFVTPSEAVAAFSLEKVSKNPAIYDTKKLTWLNGHYLNSLDPDEAARRAIPFLMKKGLVDEAQAADDFDTIRRIVSVVRERVKTLVEVADAAEYFFRDITQYDEKGIRKYFGKSGALELLREGRTALAGVECFASEQTEAAYRRIIETAGIKGGDIIHPTRLALTGRTVSPGLFDVMALLGKKRCLARLDCAIAFVEAMPAGTDR